MMEILLSSCFRAGRSQSRVKIYQVLMSDSHSVNSGHGRHHGLSGFLL